MAIKAEAKKFDASTLNEEALASQGMQEVETELMKLEVGEGVKGTYVGKDTFDTTDLKTGEVKTLQVYNLKQEDGAIARILGVTMIDAFFSKRKIGDEVTIIRTKNRKSSNKREVHNFRCWAPEDKQ